MNIFIAAALGFIGTVLVKALERADALKQEFQ
jgi:nucleoside-diphosphate-sugar epimerase